jgi:hypothetical protein
MQNSRQVPTTAVGLFRFPFNSAFPLPRYRWARQFQQSWWPRKVEAALPDHAKGEREEAVLPIRISRKKLREAPNLARRPPASSPPLASSPPRRACAGWRWMRGKRGRREMWRWISRAEILRAGSACGQSSEASCTTVLRRLPRLGARDAPRRLARRRRARRLARRG